MTNIVMQSGFRAEHDNPRHWGFEDKLRARLVATTSGDVDLRPWTSPRHNQLSTSSCVAQATVKALEIKRIMKRGREAHIDLSRLALYYLARELMLPKETAWDRGTYISHAFDAMRRFGVPPEEDWPWDWRKVLVAPSWGAMRKAYLSKIDAYYKIRSTGPDRVQMVVEALQAGNPVVFGTNVDASWFNYSPGQVLKTVSDEDREGRHATVLVGFVDGKFIGENSWGCYDDQTEVLTDQGWVPFPEVRGDEVFATLNPDTHILEYQNATHLHRYPYEGNLWRFKSQGVDLAVTPNHRMYVTNHHKRDQTNWSILRADSITGDRRICFKKDVENTVPDVTSFQVAGEDVDADSWLEFLGYFLSEGHTSSHVRLRQRERVRSYEVIGQSRRDGSTGQFIENPNPVSELRTYVARESYPEHYYRTGLSQAVGENAERIASCLSQLPFTFGSHDMVPKGNRKAMLSWACSTKGLYEELAPLGKAHEKFIPRPYLRLSQRQSRILLEALMLGDGTTLGSWVYYTSSRQLADDVQELALRCGFAADVSVTCRTDQPGYTHPEYTVGIKRTKVRPESRHSPEQFPYKGNVHCVTVPNGLLYVRRKGQAVWCGNSAWGDDGFYLMDPGVIAAGVSLDFWVPQEGFETYKEQTT